MRAADHQGNFTTGIFSRYFRIGGDLWANASISEVRPDEDPEREWGVWIAEGARNDGSEPFAYDAIRWNRDSDSMERCRTFFQRATTHELLEIVERKVKIGETDCWAVRARNMDRLLDYLIAQTK